jgi:ADP-ribose pyrophosphatase YjhB (NUDIX family)
MKEYWLENGPVDPAPLQAAFMPTEFYEQAHAGMVIACHDIFVQYDGGILLVRRRTYPAVDILWPLGGRILRGVSTEESARRKVKAECGLSLGHVRVIGQARTLFATEPFGHGKGTDSLNVVMAAMGQGELQLDDQHERPVVIRQADYTDDFRAQLHPYVRDYMDMEMARMR